MGPWRTCPSVPPSGRRSWCWWTGGETNRARCPPATVMTTRASHPREVGSRWTFARPTLWETSGCSRWAARAGSGSPPRAAGTSALSGRPTVSRADLLERTPVLRPLSPGRGREPTRRAALDGGVRPLPRLGLFRRPTVCLLARRPGRRALDRAAARPARAGALLRQRLQPGPPHAVARRPLDGLRFRRVGTRRGVRPVVSQPEPQTLEGLSSQRVGADVDPRWAGAGVPEG